MTPPAPPSLALRGHRLDLDRPVLMAIVNATPDSFSDAGEHPDAEARVQRALELAEQGAAIVDVGGQSGITGVPEVEAAEEIERVVPVVAGVHAARPDLVISVDTYKPPVVEAVLEAGAALINDVSGLLYPEVADLCGQTGAGLVVIHNRSRPKQRLTDALLYEDVTADVVRFLTAKLAQAQARGVAADALLVDPGPDFSKTPHQTVQVLRQLDRVRALGHPLLLALSRKDFVGAITQRRPRQRLAGTLAAIGEVVGSGRGTGTILRVHDVAEVADYLAVASVLSGETDLPPDAELPVHLRHEPRSSGEPGVSVTP